MIDFFTFSIFIDGYFYNNYKTLEEARENIKEFVEYGEYTYDQFSITGTRKFEVKDGSDSRS